MISYKRCSEVEMKYVYGAFKVGFSDYIIKIEMSQEDFVKRFFGPEGNSLEHSFIAFDDEKPVAVVLGGIKEYEGIKTQRCGTFAVHPDYRGKGISRELYRLHREEAVKNSCRQLFLEVIVGNDRAINFYKKMGYRKIYDISYFTLKDSKNLKFKNKTVIKKLNKEAFLEYMKNSFYDHINWQNDVDYIDRLVNMTYYGAYSENELIGALCISPSMKVFYIHIDKKLRLNGIGEALLKTACTDLEFSKLTISLPNNSSLEGFLSHLNFERDPISQYEMYLTL